MEKIHKINSPLASYKILLNVECRCINEVANHLVDDTLLAEKTKKGYQKVISGLYSYEQIMANILQQINNVANTKNCSLSFVCSFFFHTPNFSSIV